jgi:RHS repeat-associated protein
MQKQGFFDVFTPASNTSCSRANGQSDYYCFGSPMTGRTFSAAGTGKYRYGFNGKEADNEISVDGGSYDYGARIYNSRLGKWMSVDPSIKKYAFLPSRVSP